MQVSPIFEERIKDLQKQIMKSQGEKISMRDLTEKVVKSTDFDALEKSILNVANFDINIGLDRRGKKK
jgi:AAA+ superfamily predicted ATPase